MITEGFVSRCGGLLIPGTALHHITIEGHIAAIDVLGFLGVIILSIYLGLLKKFQNKTYNYEIPSLISFFFEKKAMRI